MIARRTAVTAVFLALVSAAAAAPGSVGAAPAHPHVRAASTGRAAVARADAARTAARGRITFGAPPVVDPVHTYGEPDIRVAPDGSVYDSGPWGTGTQRSLWEQSTDRGRSFHVLHTPPVQSPDQPRNSQ